MLDTPVSFKASIPLPVTPGRSSMSGGGGGRERGEEREREREERCEELEFCPAGVGFEPEVSSLANKI